MRNRVGAATPLEFVEPMSPTLVEAPPAGAGWITEIKWDGYRTLLIKDDRGSRAYTRNGHDWTAKYWPITLAAEVLPCRSAIIDGEMVVLDGSGRSSFDALEAAIGRQFSRLVFVGFDLLHLDGVDLRKLPLVERRDRLKQLVADSAPRIQFSEELPGTPQQVFDVADKAGLEGVVCKQADSPYVSGKAKAWLKVKGFEEAEFDLVGVKREHGKPALALLARNGEPAGSAFITLPAGIRERLRKRVQEAAKPSRRKAEAGIEWMQPGIKGRVRYLKGEGALRHATLRDWREDGA